MQSNQFPEDQVRGCLLLISRVAIRVCFGLDHRCLHPLLERLRAEIHAVDVLLKEFRIMVFEIDHSPWIVVVGSEEFG